uniref:Immunoglobulin V-set domain-containing protein n=1 Tax=Terrapene triunguis TaxID=2587831 RepID=A0A674JI59_9SAUR
AIRGQGAGESWRGDSGRGVSAVEVKTPEELFVENGTEARLPCPFSSSEVISSATSVSWSFQPEGATTPISVRALCLG